MFIDEILLLNSKLIFLSQIIFEKELIFETTIKKSFQNTLKNFSNSPIFLALYCDNELKQSNIKIK